MTRAPRFRPRSNYITTLDMNFNRWSSNKSIIVSRLSIYFRRNAHQLEDREVRASRASHTEGFDANPMQDNNSLRNLRDLDCLIARVLSWALAWSTQSVCTIQDCRHEVRSSGAARHKIRGVLAARQKILGSGACWRKSNHTTGGVCIGESTHVLSGRANCKSTTQL